MSAKCQKQTCALGTHQRLVEHCVAGSRHADARLGETVDYIAPTGHHSCAEPLCIWLANSLSFMKRGVGPVEPFERR